MERYRCTRFLFQIYGLNSISQLSSLVWIDAHLNTNTGKDNSDGEYGDNETYVNRYGEDSEYEYALKKRRETSAAFLAAIKSRVQSQILICLT